MSSCTCTEDYHGKHCELKTGCSRDPCKHKAECKNNPLNKTDYSCKCTAGYVGKNCDQSNLYFAHFKCCFVIFTFFIIESEIF